MKYFLYKNEDNAWQLVNSFSDKNQFMHFLAWETKKASRNRRNMICPVIEGLNVTRKDTQHIIRHEVIRDEDGYVKLFDGLPSYKTIHDWQLYPYNVQNEFGASVDIRTWKREVIAMASDDSLRAYNPKYRPRGKRPTSHRTANYRKIIELNDVLDVDEELLTAHQMSSLSIRGKRMEEGKSWGGPFWSYSSSGWKSNRNNQKQWSMRQLRDSDATYVEGYSKRNAAFDAMEVPDSELALCTIDEERFWDEDNFVEFDDYDDYEDSDFAEPVNFDDDDLDWANDMDYVEDAVMV